ncbi:MAG: DUF6788 family protein [bacterium]
MQTSENTIRTRLSSRAKNLGTGGISAGGSLTRVLRKCGKAGCRCAADPSARHEAHLLTWKVKGKTQAAYVPVDIAEEVRQWTQERRRLKKVLAEMDVLVVALLKCHSAASRAKKEVKLRLS